jgi:hypothetical protein
VAVSDRTIVLDDLDADFALRAVRALAPATDAVIRRMASFAGGDHAVAAELVQGLSADQRAGRAACPLVPPHLPARFTASHAPTLDALDDGQITALALVAADTTADVTVIRAALERIGERHDHPSAPEPLAALQHDRHVAVEGTTIRIGRTLLDVAAYQRLDPGARRVVHHALAAAMTAPHHEAARAWQLAEAADGRANGSSTAMAAVARAAAERVTSAKPRSPTSAPPSWPRATRSGRPHWSPRSACGPPSVTGQAVRRLLAAPAADVGTRIARSAAVRWLDGDAGAAAELRAAAPTASDAERPVLDALFADAAFASGHVREAVATARRVVDERADGPAGQLATALLILAGEAPLSAAGSVEPNSATGSSAVVRGRATLRYAEACLLMGDLDGAEQALGRGSEGPPPWDPAERTAPAGPVDVGPWAPRLGPPAARRRPRPAPGRRGAPPRGAAPRVGRVDVPARGR